MALCAVGGLVVLGALLVAWALAPFLPTLRNDLGYLCMTDLAYTPVSPVPLEGPNAVGQISWFPLGIRCLYWAGDRMPWVPNQIEWLSTYVAASGLILMVASPAVLLWRYLKETA
ncbi:hypothetical protein BJQ94_13960 [Cryobacterium sp. SO2]|uniref:hypothetical protein n=1 Tax=Cryobacterium sp. SO2 TaxID=1897060 RepID=UPI00223DBDBE|nr:hypothetical protein [Cryobacterium sp. SO2]WEO76462.1 hypothetical protein BJQ94_13960 [Cryobacterium sp. SO2]